MSTRKRKAQLLDRARRPDARGKSNEAPNFTRYRNPGNSVNHLHGRFDPEEFFPIRGIVGERGDQYKIDWADGLNGKKYVPTWEPKHNVTMLAVKEFEKRKVRSHQTDQGTDSPFESAVNRQYPACSPSKMSLHIPEVGCEVDAVPDSEDTSPIYPEEYSDGCTDVNAARLVASEDNANKVAVLVDQTEHGLPPIQQDVDHSTTICPTPPVCSCCLPRIASQR
jgi:hypothetical protein